MAAFELEVLEVGMKRAVVGLIGSLGLYLAFGFSAAEADLQLAHIACSAGSQFSISADTTTLTKVSNAITSLNTEALGLTCSLTLLGASTAPQTSSFTVGGGEALVGTSTLHFGIAAHIDPSTGAPEGHVVVRTVDTTGASSQIQGNVNCVIISNPTITNGYVGFMPDTGTVEQFLDTHDGGQPSAGLVDDFYYPANPAVPPGACPTTTGTLWAEPQANVVQGNVVVRPNA